MSSQFNLLDERRATDFTRERLKTDMLFTVGDKIRRLAETLSALRAAMRFLSCVDKRMLFHVRFLVEPLATKFAGERPDSGVNKQMCRQRGRAFERFRAIRAFEGLFRGVHDHVLLQAHSLGENLLA